jgi:hypothetical protein
LSGNSIHLLDDKAKMQFDSDDDVAFTCATLLLIKETELIIVKTKKRRSVWVKPWLESRLAKGANHALLHGLQVTDPMKLATEIFYEWAQFLSTVSCKRCRLILLLEWKHGCEKAYRLKKDWL